jgi:2-phosphoglycerate kinase
VRNVCTDVYWIGGSPCSGKSTIAERLVETLDWDYYRCDDFLDSYVKRGVAKNIPIMKKFSQMTLDEMWLRTVDSLVEDEFAFYRAAFEEILLDVANRQGEKPLVVEGAAILPGCIINRGIDPKRYICLVPTETFQREKYAERTWVADYLRGCSDPKLAFDHWMDRDAEFARRVRSMAEEVGLEVILVDGQQDIDANYKKVKRRFGLMI